MVGAMAKIIERTNDDLVFRAKTQANALGQLYEIYYERFSKSDTSLLIRTLK
jgi:hypothetical protein